MAHPPRAAQHICCIVEVLSVYDQQLVRTCKTSGVALFIRHINQDPGVLRTMPSSANWRLVQHPHAQVKMYASLVVPSSDYHACFDAEAAGRRSWTIIVFHGSQYCDAVHSVCTVCTVQYHVYLHSLSSTRLILWLNCFGFQASSSVKQVTDRNDDFDLPALITTRLL